jgi:two-component sensor histidine kinase
MTYATVRDASPPPVTIDEVIITRELAERPASPSDHRQIKQAIQELAAHMIDGPDEVLPRFVELAMEMGGGVSAGISIAELDASPPIFRWAFLKGSLSVFEGATTPRDFSPCGVTLDENRPILTRHSERFYTWIADVSVILPEVLLVPLHRGVEQLGTLWIVSDTLGHFNRGHVEAITEIAAFVSIALRMHQTEARLSKALLEQESLASEMSHRVKNVFNIVDGMIHLGARRAASTEELAEALSGRVRALAVAHGIIRRTFSDTAAPTQAAELGDLIRAILRPYELASDRDSRVILSGPPVTLGEHATNGVALVLHELATNAAKYGALTREDGTVDIAWTVDATELSLVWKERGGPIVSGAPSAAGFGTRLMTDTVERALSGSQRRDWRPGGVEVTLRLPLERLKG